MNHSEDDVADGALGTETDDKWRASELRRRIENRRQTAYFAAKSPVECGDEVRASTRGDAATERTASMVASRSQRDPLGTLPTVLGAKHDLYRIQGDVFESQARQLASIRCADQQFTVEKSVRCLRTDLETVQSSVRQRADRLEDVRAHIARASKSLLAAASEDKTFARTKLMAQDQIRAELVAISRCSRCGRGFLPSLVNEHEQSCSERRVLSLPELSHIGPSNNQLADALPLHGTTDSVLPRFISQPPRNLRIAEGGVRHNDFLLQWDAPIFTGSTPIIDYELKYALCHLERTPDGSTKRTFGPVSTLRLSYWCLARPVPSNTFRLTNLTANQLYGLITLAAITKNGKSAPSNQIDIFKTAHAVPPSQPLFVTIGAVTANAINLAWTEPMDAGGKPIIDYEIAFMEAVMEETITSDNNFLDVSEVVYKSRLLRTHSGDTEFTVTGLLSGKEHKQFQVRAVNTDGIPGAFSLAIESIFTIAPGNEFKLLDELQAAVNTRTRIIDSHFLSGFMQRYERHHYIDLVSRFILATHPKYETQVKAILNRSKLPRGSIDQVQQELVRNRGKHFEDLTDEEIIVERRRQFHFRVAELRRELDRVQYNAQWCRDRRLDLVALIRAAEARIIEKQAELERARMFKGQQMDSDVLENGRQRFYTKDLVIALEDEIEIEQLYILDTKAEIVKTENMLRADEQLLVTTSRRVEERLQALAVFEADPRASSRDSDSTRNTLLWLRDGILYRSFSALVQHRDECREARRKMKAALTRVSEYKVRMALSKWRDVVKILVQSQDDFCDGYGLGTTGLREASVGRDELVSEARLLLNQVRHMDSEVKTLAWTSTQLQSAAMSSVGCHDRGCSEERYAPFWLEAEAKMDILDFDGAYRTFNFIASNDTWFESMDSHRQFELQQRLGCAQLNLKNYEQALVYFNRAAFLATRSSMKLDEGTAYANIAEVFFALASLRQCINYYEQALLCFEATGSKGGELTCYRGLEKAFSKLEDSEMMLANRQMADEIEFALQNMVNAANSKLQRLQERLVGAGAVSSKEVVLERVGAIVPRLRRERVRTKYMIREEYKWIDSLKTLLNEKKELLAQGERDLKRALASDSTQVDSTVINGTNARYEIEDFKKKLAKLMGGVKAGEEHITKEILNASVRVRNAEDEIKELEEELSVETGTLMRKMQSKEGIRCFRFNATNDALKNVIGTASHGVSTCVASAGTNGYLFDLLSGACLCHALGDVHKQHLGDPTGHRSPIVSLFYVGGRIYTGSMDTTLGVWAVSDTSIGGFSCQLEKLITDFDSAVVSINADSQWLACGCSDCDVFLFDATTFSLIARIISAHERSTTSITVQSFKNTVTTGGADHKVKVWGVAVPPASSAARGKVTLAHILEAERRGDDFFNGHLQPVSCVRQIASEIVSGDMAGRIIIWNLETESKLLRICDVHKAAVTCLQFDATKIVSGGKDGNICVTDFATGHLIQTLVGHQSSILDLQFDQKRLVSMACDGKLRLWYWQTKIGAAMDRKKYHFLGAGETLKSLSLKYRTSIAKLLTWNHIPDSSKLYLGQKLVVDVDTNGSASDEVKNLDTEVSVQFGKASYENLDFLAANKVKSEDVESQWAAQRLTQLAKEYFPPLTDENETTSDIDHDGEEEDSDEDSQMAVDSDHEDNGATDDGEEDNSDGNTAGNGDQAKD